MKGSRPALPKSKPNAHDCCGSCTICRTVALHGGRRDVDAWPGGGATFTVVLPGARGESAAANREPVPVREAV